MLNMRRHDNVERLNRKIYLTYRGRPIQKGNRAQEKMTP